MKLGPFSLVFAACLVDALERRALLHGLFGLPASFLEAEVQQHDGVMAELRTHHTFL